MTRKLHDRHQRKATADPSMPLTGEDAANPQVHELQSKMTELSRPDDDISNLFSQTCSALTNKQGKQYAIATTERTNHGDDT